MNILRTEAINLALERSISRERLAKYLIQQDGDLSEALGLYEKNIRLSEAFYGPLQSLEVCLRNTAFNQMCATYGDEWLTNHAAAPLNDFSRSMINDAKDAIKGDLTSGKIVAELKFAFWVGLTGPKYDSSLWRASLYKCFLIGGGKKRAVVHGRLNALRRFRNRIAHHEPIFHRPVDHLHDEILQAVGWMCADTQSWTRNISRVSEIINSN